MKKLYISGNYLIAEVDTEVIIEFPINYAVYNYRNTLFTIVEQVGNDTLKIPLADVSNWFNEAGDTAYSYATLTQFLRESTAISLSGVVNVGTGTSINNILRANSLVDQTLTALSDGSIVLAENIVVSQNVTYSNGEVTFTNAGVYSFSVQLHLDITSGTNAQFESWVEYFNGSAWVVYPNSGRYIEFGSRTEGNAIYNSDLIVSEGVKFRLKARAKAQSIDLKKFTLDNGTDSPSVVLSIVKI